MKQLGFEIRIVSQPGIACGFDDAVRRPVIGAAPRVAEVDVGAGDQVPRVIDVCPSARYSKLAMHGASGFPPGPRHQPSMARPRSPLRPRRPRWSGLWRALAPKGGRA